MDETKPFAKSGYVFTVCDCLVKETRNQDNESKCQEKTVSQVHTRVGLKPRPSFEPTVSFRAFDVTTFGWIDPDPIAFIDKRRYLNCYAIFERCRLVDV